jgi:hypothetical protein
MSTATAPDPYFKGITYNPSFFSSSSTSLTQGQANLLYLKKTTADTATALETFSAGISTTGISNTGKISSTSDISTSGGSFLGNTLTTSANSDILNICTAARSADINIGTGNNTSANAIYIGSKTGSGASITTVNINTAGSGTGLTTIGGNSATTIGGVLTVSGDATCSSKLAVTGVSTFTGNCINNGNVVLNGTNITAGISFITSAYNILTSLTTGTINIGSSTSTTTMNGTLTANSGLTLASGQYITTSYSGTITAPTSTQVGGIFSTITLYTPTTPTSNNVSSYASITLPQGSWMVFFTRSMSYVAPTIRALFSLGSIQQTNQTPVPATDYKYGITTITNATANTTYASMTVPINVITATTIYLNITVSYTGTGPTFDTTNAQFYAMRIA